MTQRIDGTDAPKGTRPRSFFSGLYEKNTYTFKHGPIGPAREDGAITQYIYGARPRMILCRDGRTPAAPDWAKCFRVWYREPLSNGEYCGAWWSLSCLDVIKGASIFGVEFSGGGMTD